MTILISQFTTTETVGQLNTTHNDPCHNNLITKCRFKMMNGVHGSTIEGHLKGENLWNCWYPYFISHGHTVSEGYLGTRLPARNVASAQQHTACRTYGFNLVLRYNSDAVCEKCLISFIIEFQWRQRHRGTAFNSLLEHIADRYVVN